MLFVDTSDEMLDFDESEDEEFCLQSDWGVSNFDLKPDIWNFDNLTKFKRNKQNNRRISKFTNPRNKKNSTTKSISTRKNTVDSTSRESSTMALENNTSKTSEFNPTSSHNIL